MLVSKAWKFHRVTPVPCTSPASQQGHIAWRCMGCPCSPDRGGRGQEERSLLTSQPRRSRVALPWMTAVAGSIPSCLGTSTAAAEEPGKQLPKRRVALGIPFAQAALCRGLRCRLACLLWQGVRVVPYLT